MIAGVGGAGNLGINCERVASKKNKSFKRQFNVLVKHKTHNKFSKKKSESQSKAVYSINGVRRDVNAAAKVITKMSLSASTKRKALKRVRALHVANRHMVQGGAKKVEGTK